MVDRSSDDHTETERVEGFAELARLAAVEVDVGAVPVLHDLVETVRRTLPGVDHVSLALGSPAAPTRVSTTTTGATRADGWQVMAGEGPSFDAFTGGRTVTSDGLTVDPRWPRLARHGDDEGGGPVTAVPVGLDGATWGVLTCYGDAVHVPDEVAAVELVARTVGSVLAGSRRLDELRAVVDQLGRALESRATIDQAKGVLMAHGGGSPDDAFERLSSISQQTNVKVREVARQIVERASERRPHLSSDEEARPSR